MLLVLGSKKDHGVRVSADSPFANLLPDLIDLCISLSIITPILKNEYGADLLLESVEKALRNLQLDLLRKTWIFVSACLLGCKVWGMVGLMWVQSCWGYLPLEDFFPAEVVVIFTVEQFLDIKYKTLSTCDRKYCLV